MNTKTYNLYLSYNKIETIHPKAFWTSESNNKTIHNELKYISLVHNKIIYVTSGTFDPLINLETILLFKNILNNINNKLIIHLNKLKTFDLYFNKLTHLPTKWLPISIEYIDISKNAIEYLSMDTFEGAFNLNKFEMTIQNMNIEYDTFSKLTKLKTLMVYPRNSGICTCTYIWYINTYINDNNGTLCNTNKTGYANIREYLKDKCKEHIPGIYVYYIYIYIYIYICII